MTVLKVSCIFLEFIFVYVFVKGIDIISFLYLKFHVMIHYLKHTFVPKIVDKLFLPLSLSLSIDFNFALIGFCHPSNVPMIMIWALRENYVFRCLF
jgi:hypothetical protein